MRTRNKLDLYDLGARVAAVAPPAATTLHYFPLFVDQSAGATFSGLSVFALFICMIPFWRKLGDMKKFLFSASTPVLWLIAVGVFYLLEEIANTVICISAAGLAGSCGSAVIMWIGKRRRGVLGGDVDGS